MVIFCYVSIAMLLTAGTAAAQDSGRAIYNARCAACHGGDGRGGERAPEIAAKLPGRTDAALSTLIRDGIPGTNMPPSKLTDAEMTTLIGFLRTLAGRGGMQAQESRTVHTSAGDSLQGTVLAETSSELYLRTRDSRIHILRKEGDLFRVMTSDGDWPTYHGSSGGNRYSPLDRINATNIGRLAPAWIFSIPGAARLQVTPVVVDGLMYVTAPNECYALDPSTGRMLWQYKRPRTAGVIGDAGSGINRGVAVSGGRLFMVTDHAHLIALDRFTGALLWEAKMADHRENYGATSAPFAAGGLVISGISGGDEGVRGFLAAYEETTGKEVWRFWTVPAPGDPEAKTWQGSALAHGCAATWLTGTFDEATSTLYWPTGNPCPDYNGDERKGDNLYSDSILALDLKTGKRKWHYQYTPHDLWDWDAQQPPVLVDVSWQGSPRKLLLHANRNGFFYVLDRTNGEVLLAKPFVKKLTWASGIGPDGRPLRNPNQEPTAQGTKVCPAVEGATNWFSTSFHPGTGLYYVQTLERCNIFTKAPGKWEAGKSYYDGDARRVPGERGQKVLRAIRIESGEIAWELPQVGPASTWGGALSTAGGLVFFGEDSGTLMAADARTGKPLWKFPVNQTWKASPMTYSFDRKQYIAVAAGPNIIAFALVD